MHWWCQAWLLRPYAVHHNHPHMLSIISSCFPLKAAIFQIFYFYISHSVPGGAMQTHGKHTHTFSWVEEKTILYCLGKMWNLGNVGSVTGYSPNHRISHSTCARIIIYKRNGDAGFLSSYHSSTNREDKNNTHHQYFYSSRKPKAELLADIKTHVNDFVLMSCCRGISLFSKEFRGQSSFSAAAGAGLDCLFMNVNMILPPYSQGLKPVTALIQAWAGAVLLYHLIVGALMDL